MTGIQSLTPHMLSQWLRHEILANNLANASTPGFKRDDIAAGPATPPDPAGNRSYRPHIPGRGSDQGPSGRQGRGPM